MAIDNQQRSTIYELSKKAGLSVSTISAVLSGTWSRRGISARTAEAVKALAKAHNYMPNRQAQGLRKSVSQMTGLMIPSHNSRFFAAVAQSFELNVRRRGKCPIVVSAGRDPATERETAKTLISYSIEGLVICGAADPDGVHEICSSAGQRHVNIDLPGSKVSSVISDNFNGGLTLTSAIIETGNKDGLRANDIHFFGGCSEVSTLDRIRGFKVAVDNFAGPPTDEVIHFTGYDPAKTCQAFETYYQNHSRVPRRIFLNSTLNYEGFLRFSSRRPDLDLSDIEIGCCDYDPFASFCIFRTWMIKQDVVAMMEKAFDILDKDPGDPTIYYITPILVPPRSSLPTPELAMINVETGAI